MDSHSVFSAPNCLGTYWFSVDYPVCVRFRFAAELLRCDQIIDESSSRFLGRIAKDPSKLGVDPQYAVFYIKKNDCLGGLFEQLIQLRLLFLKLFCTLAQGCFPLLPFSDVRYRAHELEAATLIR